ncbi:outer membrane assembly protein BamC [Lonsdalea populi]|uniref:Outer membrane protein assembly factor BamC n=1 Tax=Lonsdalea populi TaxID=1172565 RepID=A0A3N0ULD7_9GAMM|nr:MULTISPECIES: outer membrane protein assembly factor BamC [Lonsdalea]RAT17501.1 outer membrane assembly protein BamC [Lonsdalea quercina]RAT30093.1 outer membrane assembly protein BamC [Lonsdalea populi]RAT37980.1 outer membrane assembly protein BamC [Lonsdalea populi]RAT48419.1 outer membrane assembly protein BamC [Lonsdalea populi]RAT53410.1 outer membrane assembly protein BamC [Lonsdalea populi]
MSSSLKKSMVATVVGLSLIALLTACTNDQRYKRQVNGDESYLQTPEHRALNVPSGMILPLQNGDYDLPPINPNGQVGKNLDIRPPMQSLALLNGSRGQVSGNTATLLLENSAQNSQLWSQIVQVMQSKGYTIDNRQDASQTLTTGWISWNSEEEKESPYQARYEVSLKPQGYQLALGVKLLALQQNNASVDDAFLTQRYTSQMMNSLSDGLEKAVSARENAQSHRGSQSLDVQSAADDAGLPLIVVRGSYVQVWDRLPKALENIGMTVNDRSRPQGSVSVTYRSPGSDRWDALGAKDPQMTNGDYKLQVGDLGNRSSLQFIDSKGRTLTQSQNDALVAVFQAAFNR